MTREKAEREIDELRHDPSSADKNERNRIKSRISYLVKWLGNNVPNYYNDSPALIRKKLGL